jgi:hypothetical protein
MIRPPRIKTDPVGMAEEAWGIAVTDGG